MLTLSEVLADARQSPDFEGLECTGVNSRGANGTTPLHFMAVLGDIHASELLLDAGAHIDAIDNSGCTALHVAVELQHEPLIELLVSRGASSFVVNDKDESPLSRAEEAANKRLIKLLRNVEEQ